jgi:hypothetical protein
MPLSANKDLFVQILEALFGSGKVLLNPDNEDLCLEGYYLSQYQVKNTAGKIDYSKNKFVQEVLKICNRIVDNNFPLEKNFEINYSSYESAAAKSYTSFKNNKWIEPGGNNSNLQRSGQMASLKNFSKDIPRSWENMKTWLGEGLNPEGDGSLDAAINTYSEFIKMYDAFEKKIQDYLNVAMYNAQEVKYVPDVRAFFTSYVPEDTNYQFQEIRLSDGRLYTRWIQDGQWTNWDLGSPDKTGTKTIELTSGDVGCIPLGSSSINKFNVKLEALKPGETLFALTRDIMVSGLPESLRYGSAGYRNTPDEILNNPVKSIRPNSKGCYGLFDPQNDINEPDSNGIMEIMPSTELFSEDVPRPLSEQQRGWLETRYDGNYYFQNWEPMSPTNSNWCDELDCPRYTYYRKGTLQIADQISGKKPFIQWTKWNRKDNVDTVVDWGLINKDILENKIGYKESISSFSVLSLSDLYNQPNDTTYMWTLHDDSRVVDKNIRITGIPNIMNEAGPPLKLITSKENGGIYLTGNSASQDRRSIFSKITCTKTKDIIYYEWRDLGQLYETGLNDDNEFVVNVKTLAIDQGAGPGQPAQQWMFPDESGETPLPRTFFRLKEKSSDFCYYREGRIISVQDYTELPDKVFKTYTSWDAWHSLDDRLIAMESRLNFIESLQGLPPASNYFWNPVLAQDLRKNTGSIIDFGKSRKAKLTGIIIGEPSFMYLLRFGYNPPIDKYDTLSSFWGDSINYMWYESGSWPMYAAGIQGLPKDDKGGGSRHDHSGRPYLTIGFESSQIDRVWSAFDYAETFGRQIFPLSTTSIAIMATIQVMGIAGASLGPLAIAAGVAGLAAFIASQGILTGFRNMTFKPYLENRCSEAVRKLWSPDLIPFNNLLAPFLKHTPVMSAKNSVIDTSIWGWLYELKRRTDIIKFFDAFLIYCAAIITHLMCSVNGILVVMSVAVMLCSPATGTLTIPFASIGMGGPGITTLAYFAAGFIPVPLYQYPNLPDVDTRLPSGIRNAIFIEKSYSEV